MPSILSYVWNSFRKRVNKKKRAAFTNRKIRKTSEDSVPDVAPSSTGDENFSPSVSLFGEKIASLSIASCGSDDNSFHTAIADDEKDLIAIDSDVNEVVVPTTPEGLKPRRSLAFIRRELGIPILKSQKREKRRQKRANATLKLCSPKVKKNEKESLPLLPPHSTTLPNGFSPQISNSSFYSRSSSFDPIAASPNFAAPVTAVGALVASTTTQTEAYGGSVLPPAPEYFPQNQQDQFTNDTIGVLPPRNWTEMEERDEDSDSDSDVFRPYQQLHDDDENKSSRGFGRRLLWKEQLNEDDRYESSSITSRDSSHVGSQVALVEQQQQSEKGSYNFDPIINLDVSAISGQTDDYSSLQSIGDYNLNKNVETGAVKKSFLSSNYFRTLEEEEDVESMLLKRKRYNQQRNKEKVVLDCITRLQSNTTLISNIITDNSPNAISSKEKEDSSIGNNEDGLLQGMPVKKNEELTKTLGEILLKMDTGRNNDIIGIGSSRIVAKNETQTDLKSALHFLKKILSSGEKNQTNSWMIKQPILNKLTNSFSVESPKKIQRGGDTSVFTLPEDIDTPYTSNLSVATTITSKHTSPSYKEYLGDAATIQQTIKIICTLLKRMSEACERLMETNHTNIAEAIYATEDIKILYLQLLSMKEIDLRAVSDAFVEQPRILVRTVSVEEDQMQEQQQLLQLENRRKKQKSAIFRIPSKQMNTLQKPNELLKVFSKKGIIVALKDKSSGNDRDLSASTPTRIEEIKGEKEEDDDLRRQVGSNDYDCNDCREGPEMEERDSGIDREGYSAVRNFYQDHDMETLSTLSAVVNGC